MKSLIRALPIAGAALLAGRALRRGKTIDFAGRSVVITGGSRGLGLVIARQFAAEGARLTLLARNAADLERARSELQQAGAEVVVISCDVRDQRAVQSAVEQTAERYGSVDILVNNAGVIQAGPIEHMQLKDFEDAMAVHLWGPLYTMLAVIPLMRQQGSGRIVNISSIGGRVAVPHLAPYSTSKFALVGLSDAMRGELAKDNIQVTTVCPGLLRTGSPINALFKGRHAAEFAWFSIIDANPLASISAERAAAQILDACRHGEPELTISTQARVLAILNAVAPGVMGSLLALGTRFLPGPTDRSGDQVKTGWESQSSLSPSVLTRLSDQAAAENNELRTFTTQTRRHGEEEK